jgi:hypothetical protein
MILAHLLVVKASNLKELSLVNALYKVS